MDPIGILATPSGLPLRRPVRVGAQDALYDTRCAPRPSTRQAAPTDAAYGQYTHRLCVWVPLLQALRRWSLAIIHGRVAIWIHLLRPSTLPLPLQQASDVHRPVPQTEPHAPPFCRPFKRFRCLQPSVGLCLLDFTKTKVKNICLHVTNYPISRFDSRYLQSYMSINLYIRGYQP